mmetsp:Transcript_16461/g.31047  ORF Transcript_16461/g.31047 Transcript_16461/m.31047 type:complete len:324 (+) Transcript_16461:1521-2492(+)
MLLVLLGQTFQNSEGLLICWFWDVDGLETSLKGLVFLDVFSVLLNGCGSDDLKFATRQSRLHDVSRVDGTTAVTGASCTHDSVDLVDHQNDLLLRVQHLFDHVLQSLLKLSTVAGSSQQHGQVQLDDSLALQQFRNVAGNDLLGQALGNSRLSDARLSDQHWIVLLPSCQNLDGALQFRLTAHKRIHLAFLRGLSQVISELFQRHRLARTAAAGGHTNEASLLLLLQFLDDLFRHLLWVHAQLLQNLDTISISLFQEGEQNVSGVNGVGIQSLCFLNAIAENSLGCRSEGNLYRDHPASAADHVLHSLSGVLQRHVELFQNFG